MSIDSISPFSLIPDKQYTIKTQVGEFESIIKGTFNRYESKIINEEEHISIVMIDWEYDGNPYINTIPLYLSPNNNNLAFYEIQ
jgi:hypothetical protein